MVLDFLFGSAKRACDWGLLRYARRRRHLSPAQHPAQHLATTTPCIRSIRPPHIMARPISLFSVSAILILAIDDGSRILTKYYSNPHPPAGNPTDYPGQIAYKTVKDQKAFEKGLLGG